MTRRTSASDQRNYPAFCAAAAVDAELFRVFRAPTNKEYGKVLEHFPQEEGARHLAVFLDRNAELAHLLPRFASSNAIGSPELFDYGPHGRHSAATLRYARHAGDMHEKFGSLDGLHIVEIGGGYGGLCKVVFDAFAPASYTLVDLPEALALARRFLSEAMPDNIDRVRFVDGTTLQQRVVGDLAISNCAFSECIPVVQRSYLENILAHAARGSLLINVRRESLPPAQVWHELSRFHHDLVSAPERPQTHPYNFVIAWGVRDGFQPSTTLFPYRNHLRPALSVGWTLYAAWFRAAHRIKLRKRIRSLLKRNQTGPVG